MIFRRGVQPAHTLLALEKPGGSGTPAFSLEAAGGILRSKTHFGGGGTGATEADMIVCN